GNSRGAASAQCIRGGSRSASTKRRQRSARRNASHASQARGNNFRNRASWRVLCAGEFVDTRRFRTSKQCRSAPELAANCVKPRLRIMPYVPHTHSGAFSMIGTTWRLVLALVPLVFAATSHAQDKLTFSTDWLAEAEHGGFYQALAEGIYKRHGLDVELKSGGPQVNGL